MDYVVQSSMWMPKEKAAGILSLCIFQAKEHIHSLHPLEDSVTHHKEFSQLHCHSAVAALKKCQLVPQPLLPASSQRLPTG
jgi:hypothetical protein